VKKEKCAVHLTNFFKKNSKNSNCFVVVVTGV
jgi:hypothetical protein